MQELTLTDQQVQIVRESDPRVSVCDPSGREIGVLIRHECPENANVYLTPEVVEILIERMSRHDNEWIPSEQVLKNLGSDEMIARLKTKSAS